MTKDHNGPLYTIVDDELYDELAALTGQTIVFASVWEDSFANALEDVEGERAKQEAFDVDLYLEGGVYFELYAVACYTDPDGDPLVDLAAVDKLLTRLARRKAVLAEVAVNPEDALVLVLQVGTSEPVYLEVAAWLLEPWDELPEP